jgi:RNA polymerase sigma factor (sigma-70 family)
MSRSVPAVVERLLHAAEQASVDGAWSEFLEEYGRLIMHGARSLGGSHDAVMDRYAYVLEQLRRDDCHKLRGYVADGRGKFTTWLLVVVRRLCMDEARKRYGRPKGEPSERDRARRRLADLVAAEVDPDFLPGHTPSPEEDLRTNELYGELHAAMAELEPSERLLLRLRFQDEVPASEIARICSFPNVFHVYRRLNRIFDRLRRDLLDSGVRDANP